jgi:hypothetical protein
MVARLAMETGSWFFPLPQYQLLSWPHPVVSDCSITTTNSVCWGWPDKVLGQDHTCWGHLHTWEWIWEYLALAAFRDPGPWEASKDPWCGSAFLLPHVSVLSRWLGHSPRVSIGEKHDVPYPTGPSRSCGHKKSWVSIIITFLQKKKSHQGFLM